MKHGSLISPDESAFGFGPSKIASATHDSVKFGDTSDAITIPDAQLLFNGEFKRAGDDLKIIGDDGKSFLVSDYFKNDKRPALLSPEGAALTGDVVEALAGPLAPGQYAQAGAPQSAGQAIGRVEKVDGNASVVRNGVTITLNAGDVIQKGDVAQTGTGSSLAIVFSDGTAFNLASNARMVLNDFVYSAGGGNNSALISLVQGSISFVAGQVAKTGDMRVDTPVATMGIRGTAVLIEINANNGQTKFSVMMEPNGVTGVATLHQINPDGTRGALLATVNNSAIGWIVTPAGPLQVIAQQIQKSPAELAMELAVVQQVFQTFNAGQNNPFDPGAPQGPQPPADPNKRGDNPNPQQNAGGGTQIIPSDTNTIKVTVTVPSSGGPTGTITTPTNPNTPTVPGTPATPGTPTGGVTTTEVTVIVPVINQLYGTTGIDTFGPDNTYNFLTTDGIDWVFAGAGDDIIVAGHGGGDDRYDGGADEDTIKFESARDPLTGKGVTFHLNEFVVDNIAYSTAQSAMTGSDVFFNIEKIVASPGDDVFILHDAGNWEIDAGAGFDIVKLIAGLDIYGEGGPEISNFEMVDLTNDGRNIVEFEGGGIDEHNPNQELRIIGDSQDVVRLTQGGADGHWEFVSGGRFTDSASDEASKFADHFSDYVTFDTYIFVSDYEGGEPLAWAYIDTDITVVNLIEADANGQGTATSSVRFAPDDEEITYDLTGWTQAFGGHSYKFFYFQEGEDSSWDAARLAALASGGYLATISSQAENDFVTQVIGYPAGYTGYIGLSDAGTEGTYVWANGEAVTYFNWASDEPNNSGNEDFVIVVAGPGGNEGGHWNDTGNGGARGYVVEYNIGAPTMFGIYGYVTLNTETNELTYHLDNDDPDTQALAEGQIVTESFNVVVSDGGNPSVSHPVRFTIAGANDAPVISIEDFHSDLLVQEMGPEETLVLGLEVSDVDAGLAEIFHVTVTAKNGTLRSNDSELTDEDENDAVLSFSGSLNDPLNGINAGLESGIIYTPSNEPGAPDTDTVSLTVEDAKGGSDTINFVFSVFGVEGANLSGTDKKDLIFGTGHSDTLTGNDGNDTFIFSFFEPQIGSDTITDFDVTPGENMDTILFEGAPFATFAQLQPYISYAGGNATINLGEMNTIVLNNVANLSLTADHFIINPGTL